MTDSEKLDLLLTKVQGMETEMKGMKDEMQGIKDEVQGMKTEMQGMKTEMQDMKDEMQGMKKKLDKLSLGQLEIKKEIIMLNRKISDTYDVALDALGTSTENREWLEKGTLA